MPGLSAYLTVILCLPRTVPRTVKHVGSAAIHQMASIMTTQSDFLPRRSGHQLPHLQQRIHNGTKIRHEFMLRGVYNVPVSLFAN
jgi:hypothetical protein